MSSRLTLSTRILLAIGLGMLTGLLLGERASAFGELGKIVIQLIKAVASPLVFLVVVNAVLQTEVELRAGGRLLKWATLNATIALMIGLALSNLIQPGRHLAHVTPHAAGDVQAYVGRRIDLWSVLGNFVPSSIVSPFLDNQILAIVVIALLFGFGLRRARRDAPFASGARTVEGALAALLRVVEVVLTWVVALIPFAVFGVVARAVGEHGFEPLKGLGVYVGVGLLGLASHILLTYQAWLVIFAKRPLGSFWREAKEPVIYAMGANSSLATLPVTLRALDRLGVSKRSSTLGAVVGTNFNNDGIILYEGMAVLFVAQANGIDLTIGQQILAAASCMIAAMGVAGVPEAGFISLALVLNTVGLPIEILPLLLTVDWIIARARSVTNVLSDMMLSILVDGPPSSATSDAARR
jgi:DAACS family dicarboxylate/amino acid:cation (Na+ or H+) symporter